MHYRWCDWQWVTTSPWALSHSQEELVYCNTIAQSKLACSKMVLEFRAAVRSARTENGFSPLCYTMYALILGWKKRARMSELSPLFSLSPGTVFTLCIIAHSTSCNRLSHQWWSHSSFSSALGFLGGILLFTASSSFVILCTPPRWTMNGDQRSFFPAYNGVKLKREREILSKLCKQWKGNALLYCSICILWSIMQPNCPSWWGAHLCFLLFCCYVDEPNYHKIETPCCGIEIRW